MSTKAEREQAAQDHADNVTALRELFPAGSTVHTVIRHVTQSGMGRSISVLATDGTDIWDVSYRVARALGWKVDQRHGGVKVNGAGMDMSFHLVYSLAQNLYGVREGYALSHRSV